MLVPNFKTRDFCITKVILHVLDLRHELFRHDFIGLRPDLVARILKQIIGRYKNRLPFLCIFEEDIINYLVRGGSFSMVRVGHALDKLHGFKPAEADQRVGLDQL